MRIVLTGGGSGGHVFPLIAVARKIKEKIGSEAEFLYIGSGADIEKEMMDKEGISAKHVLAGKRRRYFSLRNFIDFFKIPAGIIQSLWMLLRYMPDVVFSKGGYVSVPVALAAWVYRIPVIIHESDAVPGTANQIIAKFCRHIIVAYPEARQYFESRATALWGNPVRENINQGNIEKARQIFHFTESKPTVLVMGGSQGSRIINEAIIKILPKILFRTQVIHQTGEKNYDEVVHKAAEQGIKAGREGYYPVKFLGDEEIKEAYALADLVISRAGAGSIAEIAANKKPSILIPLENSANDHQRMNAYALAKIGGALVLEETNLGEHIFLEKIEKILDDNELREKMAREINFFHHPQAAEHIAAGVIETGNE